MRAFKTTICLMSALSLAFPGWCQTSSATTSTTQAAGVTPIARNGLLSGEGQILAGPEPNSIMVIDYPDNLKQVEDYVKMIDVAPKQVLIEARVVEVTLEGEKSLGVNWSLAKNASGGPINMGRFNIGSSTTEGLAQAIDYKTTQYPPGTSGGEEDPFTVTIFDENINLVLKMLANSYDTNILSAPSITGVNNRTSKIEVVTSLPWAEPEATTSDSGATTVTWTMHFENVGISLKVTPTITDDGNVIMDLQPEVSEHVDDYSLTMQTESGTEVPYTVPIIDKRNADTKVVVGDGKTLIIGGLMKDKIIKGSTKVPLLGDLPVLGRFFKSTKDTHEKTELLIFVSPKIVTDKLVDAMQTHEKNKTGKWYYNELATTRLCEEKMSPVDKAEIKSDDELLARRLTDLEKKVIRLRDKREKVQASIASKTGSK